MILLLFACKPDYPVEISVDEALQPVFTEFVLGLQDERVGLVTGRAQGEIAIEVKENPDCLECYQIEGEEGRYIVIGGVPLGVQYGVAEVLEALGYRFWHPYAPFSPPEFEIPAFSGTSTEPAMTRRGIHLHTLHPIEGLQAVWMDRAAGQSGSEANLIVDWVIKNRGNHLQWPALDDIIDSAATREEWAESTKNLIDTAHSRGITVGVGLQLFGSGNLQRAFDLVDDPGDNEEGQVTDRLRILSDGLDWDTYNLSFGEFAGEEPETFIKSINIAYSGINAIAPEADVPATIHVGNYPELRVEYQGEELLYYFLVKFADPGITPWIHSVMYYNLYEDAGGAYLHEEFDEHRAFLEERLAAGEPVGYFPETAYWVAFDNPVPQYLPLYIRSRQVDLDNIGPSLEDQVLFSTGWEWGYWQGDVISLRMSAGQYKSWEEAVLAQFAPLQSEGELAADAVIALAELQHEFLLEGRLAAYLGGREAIIDIGDTQGIVSQPDRPSFEEVQQLDESGRALFQAEVLDALKNYAEGIEAIQKPEVGAWTGSGARVVAEVVDGLEVDALRARFIGTLYDSVLNNEPTAISTAESLLEEARVVVARRHADFHDPEGSRWIATDWDTPTVYDFGYLRRADELCFWERELIQVQVLIAGSTETIPACAL